jgi:ribosomal protein S8
MNQILINAVLKLKNNALKKKNFTVLKKSKLIFILLNLFYKKGLIQSFSTVKNSFFVYLHYPVNVNVLENLRVLSKPSQILYLKYADLIKIKTHNRLLFVSTSIIGLTTSYVCKKLKIGGVACFIC